MDIFEVIIAKQAQNELERIPLHIAFKLQIWIDGVRTYGLREMRKRPGFHDESLKGNRKGQ